MNSRDIQQLVFLFLHQEEKVYLAFNPISKTWDKFHKSFKTKALCTQMIKCKEVAKKGLLLILKWARLQKGCPWNEQTCAIAAENGHFEILKWAREQGCPWDEWTCAYAARNGHFEILKWAREQGCPWDKRLVHMQLEMDILKS